MVRNKMIAGVDVLVPVFEDDVLPNGCGVKNLMHGLKKFKICDGGGVEDDSFKISLITIGFESLFSQYNGKKVPLCDVDEMLRGLHEDTGISTAAFRTYIKSKGVCLGNCRVYGSQRALRAALISNPKLIVPKRRAKLYKYVKMCLIALG